MQNCSYAAKLRRDIFLSFACLFFLSTNIMFPDKKYIRIRHWALKNVISSYPIPFRITQLVLKRRKALICASLSPSPRRPSLLPLPFPFPFPIKFPRLYSMHTADRLITPSSMTSARIQAPCELKRNRDRRSYRAHLECLPLFFSLFRSVSVSPPSF